MSPHGIYEWVLVGAFLVSGLRHLFAFVGHKGATGYPSLGISCLAIAAMAATLHAAPLTLGIAIALVFALSSSWFVVADVRTALTYHAGLMCALALGALACSHVLARAEPHASILQRVALAAPIVAFELCMLAVAWRRRQNGWPGAAVLLLGIAALSGSMASVYGLLVPELLGLSMLLPLLAAATAIESRDTAASIGGQANAHEIRQELLHTSRLSVVGELTASIAHEINQPLAAILSNADAGEILLENTDFEPDEIQRILSDIRRDGLRAGEMIRNVRTLAQKREPDLVELDLNQVVQSVTDLLHQEARRRRIRIVSTPLGQPALVRGDSSLLMQVVINLVLNAMDALEAVDEDRDAERPLPPVEIGVFLAAHDEIEIRVVDQGTGIPEMQLNQLFDSFYTSKSHGMGLGLSISRSIVLAHGGRILASNNPSRGATFHVFIPPYLE